MNSFSPNKRGSKLSTKLSRLIRVLFAMVCCSNWVIADNNQSRSGQSALIHSSPTQSSHKLSIHTHSNQDQSNQAQSKQNQSNQSNALNFNHLTAEDGLSQNSVYHITQDHLGFIWIATQDGLNRYDGKEFKVFRHNFKDKHSLSENDTRVIYEDTLKRLWIGTQAKGLNLFDRANQSFKHYIFNDNEILLNYVELIEESEGYLWLGTRGGLIKFDPKTEDYQVFRIEQLHPYSSNNRIRGIAILDQEKILLTTNVGLKLFDTKSETFSDAQFQNEMLNNNHLTTVVLDSKKEIWIASFDAGIFHIDPVTKNVTNHQLIDKNKLPIKQIRDLYEDFDGIIWVTTISSGLYSFDPQTHKVVDYQSSTDNPTSLNHNNVLSIFQDKSGLFWLGVLSKGISTFNPKRQSFKHFLSTPYKKNSLSNSNVWSILKSSSGQYWFSTNGGGLNSFDPATDKYNAFLHHPEIKNSLPENKIWSIGERDDGQFWLGGFFTGLSLFAPKTGQVDRRLNAFSESKENLVPNSVLNMLHASDGTWWFATRNQGVARYNNKEDKFQFYTPIKNTPSSFSASRVYAIYQDKQQKIWIGSDGGGLSLYIPENDDFQHFVHQQTSPTSLLSNTILSISENNKGEILLGTDKGLSIMKDNNYFKNITEENGLSNSVINSVLFGCDENVWVATNKGISRITPSSGDVFNFGRKDGLINQEYNTSSFYQAEHCELLFGGNRGAVSIIPKMGKSELVSPELMLTNILKYYEPVHFEQDVSKLEQLDFSFKDQVISFVFALMDFNNPTQHQYYYKLNDSSKDNNSDNGTDKGKDKNSRWISLGTQNQLTLTNLDYGHHTLEVKGRIAANNFSKVKTFNIYVTPPFWRTPLAYTFYALLIIILIVFYVKKQQKELTFHKVIADKEREISEQLRRLDKLKDQFLANTSHELRTPLNAIIGLSDVITEQGVANYPSDELEGLIKIMRESGENLLTLVNDILDYSAINENKLRVVLKSTPLKPLIDNAIIETRLLNTNKNLAIYTDIPNNLPPIRADKNRIHQVLLNLLGNAIKFTSKGSLTIKAFPKGDFVVISVSDTGIGIPENMLVSIFNRFEQVDGNNNRRFGGAGLGLTITKELVDLHEGMLTVSSVFGKGTTFEVSIPIFT